MKSRLKQMSYTGFLLVLLTAALTMAANLLLRAGIDSSGGFAFAGTSQFAPAIVKLFKQPLFVLGFIIYIMASIVWFRVVATEPLSLAYPILVSLTFTLVTIGAFFMFSEPMSLRKIIGLGIVLIGVAILSVGEGRSR